jgi:hypothetical protein
MIDPKRLEFWFPADAGSAGSRDAPNHLQPHFATLSARHLAKQSEKQPWQKRAEKSKTEKGSRVKPAPAISDLLTSSRYFNGLLNTARMCRDTSSGIVE